MDLSASLCCAAFHCPYWASRNLYVSFCSGPSIFRFPPFRFLAGFGRAPDIIMSANGIPPRFGAVPLRFLQLGLPVVTDLACSRGFLLRASRNHVSVWDTDPFWRSSFTPICPNLVVCSNRSISFSRCSAARLTLPCQRMGWRPIFPV